MAFTLIDLHILQYKMLCSCKQQNALEYEIVSKFTYTDRIQKCAGFRTAWKLLKYGVFSGPYFPIWTEYGYLLGKCTYSFIRTRKKSELQHFPRSRWLSHNPVLNLYVWKQWPNKTFQPWWLHAVCYLCLYYYELLLWAYLWLSINLKVCPYHISANEQVPSSLSS